MSDRAFGMSRRRAVRTMLAGVGSVAVGTVTWSIVSGSEGHTEWTYEGETGPDHWGDLDPTFAACSEGQEQSPIDLGGAGAAEIPDVQVHFDVLTEMTLVNSGHTIDVEFASDHFAAIDGFDYRLDSFHFHTPSEHTIGDEHRAMELHMKLEDRGQWAVLAVFIVEGEESEALKPVFDNMQYVEEKHAEHEVGGFTINLPDLVPIDGATYRYDGSLTTPPCSESVQWIVFAEPIQASTQQIGIFQGIFAANARPPQDVNDRDVIEDQRD